MSNYFSIEQNKRFKPLLVLGGGSGREERRARARAAFGFQIPVAMLFWRPVPVGFSQQIVVVCHSHASFIQLARVDDWSSCS